MRCVLLLACLCACQSARPPHTAHWQPGMGLVLASNYESSSLDAFSLTDPPTLTQNLLVASGDAVLRVLDDHTPVLLNRGHDSNLLALNHDFSIAAQVSLPLCGPHDVVRLDSGEWLLTCYERSVLMVVGDSIREIDLSALNDADGVAELDAMARLGDKIYVSVQNLDRRNGWVPSRPGRLVVLSQDLAVQSVIDLPCLNPFTRLASTNDALFVGCAGNFKAPGQAALVQIQNDQATLLADENTLGGQPLELRAANDRLFMIVAQPDPHQPLRTSQSTVVERNAEGFVQRAAVPGFSLGGLAADALHVYFGNRTATDTAGLWSFDRLRTSADGPYPTSLPPLGIDVWE